MNKGTSAFFHPVAQVKMHRGCRDLAFDWLSSPKLFAKWLKNGKQAKRLKCTRCKHGVGQEKVLL